MASDVDQKLLKQTKFPPEFNQKVDMQKVNLEVMKKWIAGKISDILGNEDDVVIELCFNLLEGSRFPNIKVLQIQLGGFLGQPTAAFCKELWSLCLSAQLNPQGVPKELLEAKKLELIQEKIQAEKAAETAQQRKEEETAKEKELDGIRQRERAERGAERGTDRGRGRGRGGRGAYDPRRHDTTDDRPLPPNRHRDNWSPPPKRRGRANFRGHSSRREMDTYIPSDRRQRSGSRSRRLRSPLSSRSPSRSLSTSPRRELSRDRDLSRPISPRPRDSRSPSLDGRNSTRKHPSFGRRRRSSPYSARRGDEWSYRHRARRSRSLSKKARRRKERSRSVSSRSPSPRRRRRVSSRSRSPVKPGRGHAPSRSPSSYGPSRKHERPISAHDPQKYSPDERADTYKDRARYRRRSPSRSPAPKDYERKRRRSIERYEPLAKRRPNTSSASSEIPDKIDPQSSNEEEVRSSD